MVVLVAVPALVSGVALTLGARALLRAETFAHMDALAEAKASEIQAQALRWIADVDLFVRRPTLREQVSRLAAQPLPPGAAPPTPAVLRSILEDLARPHSAATGDVVVVRLDNGRVLAWAGPGTIQEAQAHADRYSRAELAIHHSPWLSPAYADDQTGRPMVDVIEVVPGPAAAGGRVVAAVICQIPLDRDIAPPLEQRQGMGETGEMVLVDPTGLALKELRYEPGAVMQKVIHTVPVQLALSGEPGTAELRDYRGRAVLAAYRRIPITGWGLVVKMDLAEEEAGVARLVWLWAGLTLLVLAGGVIWARGSAAAVAHPVLELSVAAQRMAAGDLTSRVELDREDELGRLAEDFNQMVAELAAHRTHLEQRLEERTVELRTTGEQLRQEAAHRALAESALEGYEEELRSLARQVSAAEERAREAVAADLHDTVLQQLALSKLQLGALQRSATSESDRVALMELARLVQEGIDSGRAILRNLSPAGLHDRGLEYALGLLCDYFRDRHGLDCTYSHGPTPIAVGEDQRVLLFQVARELLTNVVKHAQAREARVALRLEGGALRLEVADDGAGFDPDECLRGAWPEGGFGICNLRERVKPLGGKMEVESAPGEGTRVVVEVPVG